MKTVKVGFIQCAAQVLTGNEYWINNIIINYAVVVILVSFSYILHKNENITSREYAMHVTNMTTCAKLVYLLRFD